MRSMKRQDMSMVRTMMLAVGTLRHGPRNILAMIMQCRAKRHRQINKQQDGGKTEPVFVGPHRLTASIKRESIGINRSLYRDDAVNDILALAAPRQSTKIFFVV